MSIEQPGFRPFPETPVWPKKNDLIGRPETAYTMPILHIELEGVPRTPKESVFFDERPRLIDFVYKQAIENKRRDGSNSRHIVHNLTNILISEPEKYKIIEINEALRAIITNDNRNSANHALYMQKKLPQSLELAVKSNKPKPSPELLLSIMEYMGENALSGYALFNNLKNNLHTTIERVDFAFNAAIGALNSNNNEVEKLFFKLFNFEKDVMKANDEVHTALLIGSFSLDDEILQKILKFSEARDFMKKIHFGDADRVITENLDEITPDIKKKAILIRNKNSERFDRISDYYITTNLDTFINKHQGSQLFLPDNTRESFPFPHNLTTAHDAMWNPLQSRLMIEILRGNSILEKKNLTFYIEDDNDTPTTRVKYDMKDENIWSKIIKDLFLHGVAHELKGEYPVETPLKIFYPNKLEAISDKFLFNLVSDLQEEIMNKSMYSISPRGDLVIIENETLDSIGLKSILFSPGIERQQIKVTLLIGASEIDLSLNQYFKLNNINSEKLDIPKKIRYWWEAVILSHLENIMCKSGNIIVGRKDDTSINNNIETSNAEFFSRRAHARKLPTGYSYTKKQKNKVLEELNMDLKQFNLDRGVNIDNLQEDDRVYTWVFETAYENNSQEPILIKMPNAMQKIDKQIQQSNNTN